MATEKTPEHIKDLLDKDEKYNELQHRLNQVLAERIIAQNQRNKCIEALKEMCYEYEQHFALKKFPLPDFEISYDRAIKLINQTLKNNEQ